VGQTLATITITDDDQVSVKFMQTELEIDEDSADHSVRVCILMEGVADRSVSVHVESQPGSAEGKLITVKGVGQTRATMEGVGQALKIVGSL